MTIAEIITWVESIPHPPTCLIHYGPVCTCGHKDVIDALRTLDDDDCMTYAE